MPDRILKTGSRKEAERFQIRNYASLTGDVSGPGSIPPGQKIRVRSPEGPSKNQPQSLWETRTPSQLPSRSSSPVCMILPSKPQASASGAETC